MALDDFTCKLGSTGYVLNDDPVLADDSYVDIYSFKGFDSAPPRLSEHDHEGTDGGFVDAEFDKARPISLEGVLFSTCDEAMGVLDTLKKNWSLSSTEVPLYIKWPGLGERLINVKPLGCRFDIDTAIRTGRTSVLFQAIAEDPRFYDVTQITVNVPLVSIVFTGRGYSKSYNFGYGSTTAVAEGRTITNFGNRKAPATIRINGPSVNPTIIHDTTSSQLDFTITIPSGQYLDIDLRTHTVRLNGTANRRTALKAPNWFLLHPGNNFIRYQAESGSSGSSADVIYRSAWL